MAARAQSADAFDSHCADLYTLELKSVQKELGMTTAQRDKMNVYAKEHDQKVAALKKRTAGAKVDLSAQLFAIYSELKVRVLAQLTAPQLRRLREICLQRLGLVVLCDPVVGKRVGLTDAQVKQMRKVYDAGYQEFSAIELAAQTKILTPYKGRIAKTKAEADALNKEVSAKLTAAKAAIQPQLNAVKDKYDHKMRALMSPAQNQAYETLRGKPFRP